MQNSGWRKYLWICLWGTMAAGWIVCARTTAGASVSFNDGQKVEVREGDSWSPASILKHEGRKFLVHYDGADASADEWVTADRIRQADAGPATKPATAAKTSLATRPAVVWNIGQKLEVKWGGLWRKVEIANKRGDWYLVKYDAYSPREWVEPWRLRKIGSTEDEIGNAQPNPFVFKSEGPPTPKPGPAPLSAKAARDLSSVESEQTPITEADRTDTSKIELGGDSQISAVTPDPAPKLTAAPAKHSLSLKRDATDRQPIARLLFSGPGTPFAAAFHTDFASQILPQVERLDLLAGRSLGDPVALPAVCIALALNADGTLLATRSNALGHQDGESRLDIWKIDAGEEASHLISFVPLDNQQGFRAIDAACFVGADHLLVHGWFGTLSLWEFRKARCVWAGDSIETGGLAVSASGKYFAAKSKGKIIVGETMTGKVLDRFDSLGAYATSLSFKPDGSQLAAAGPDMLMIWDLKTDKLLYDLFPVGSSGSYIDWVADGWVLLDQRKLVSLEKQIVVWSYSGLEDRSKNLAGMFAGKFWFVKSEFGRSAPPALCGVTLPDEAARAAADTVDTPTQMIVHPGMSVSLEVNVPASRDRIFASLRAQLKENGITVADNQPIKLVARIGPGETRQMKYSSMMGPRGAANATEMSVQDIKGHLAYETGGKVLWERNTVVQAPPMLWLKNGQTIAQAVADAMKPPLSLFETARIPTYVPKNPDGLGTSSFTSTGIAATGHR